jgi:FHA domain-containing protein
MITLVILSLLALSIAIGWLLTRRKHRALREREDIPLFAVPGASAPRPARPPVPPPQGGASTSTSSSGRGGHEPVTARDSRFAPSAATIRTRDGAVSTVPMPVGMRAEPPIIAVDDEMGEAFEGASVRFWRVADGTLQFLPGRLEIAAGRDAGQEIRFVRTGGPDGTVITFGRAEGAPYRHVQLREPTVSRSHARMTLEHVGASDGSRGTTPGGTTWRLQNLSTTNPVVVNGRALDVRGGPSASVILSDGDRIEMGEVAFVFHAR